jgi:DNA-directed RNA polymerase-3 subunit RPC5
MTVYNDEQAEIERGGSAMSDEHDDLVAVLPIHYSNALAPNAHIQQYPLFRMPLQVPMSAILNGDQMRARTKPNTRRVEIHVPMDNGEIRLQSERVPQKCVYVVGVIRNGTLEHIRGSKSSEFNTGRFHLHPVGDIQQLRPSLTHLDEQQSNKSSSSKIAGVAAADSDDGAGDRVAIPGLPRREDVNMADAKEALVTTRKSGDLSSIHLQSGVTAVRREMLLALRLEEDGRWEELAFCGADVR